MINPNQVPSGSEPINPLETPAAVQAAPEPATETPEASPQDAALAKMEGRLKEKDAMIGKHGNTINSLKNDLSQIKAQMQSLSQPQAKQGPGEQEQMAELYKKMDSGEIGIAEGMNQALAINANLTAKTVAQQIAQNQQQQQVASVQQNFLKKNPDFNDVVQSGVLSPYLEEDPMHDNYSAFLLYKKDQQFADQQKETDAKVQAAKEEGARLAKGAEAAGKVIGKQGQSTMQTSTPKPFKNNQEASAAMLETLKQMRASSST